MAGKKNQIKANQSNASQETDVVKLQETVALLEGVKAELEVKVAELEKIKSEQDDIIQELMNVQKSFDKAVTTGKPVMTVNGTDYNLAIPRFKFKGKTYDINSLMADESAQKELVKIGSTVLKKV